MRALAFITFALLIIGMFGCADHDSDYRQMASQIRNENVTWDGNYLGLQVGTLGEVEQRVLTAGSPCRPFLLEALDDEARYVAAHVLLTQMQQSYPFSADHWNHLKVKLGADGRVEIPSGQKPEIKKLWAQK